VGRDLNQCEIMEPEKSPNDKSYKSLNDSRIKAYKAPQKTKKLYDRGEGSVPGLYVNVYPTGRRVFFLRYQINKKREDFRIGEYPEIGLAEARELAKRVNISVADGHNPAADRRRNRNKPDAMTIADLAEAYKAEYLPNKKESTQITYTSRINKIVRKFGKVPVDELSGRDIKVWLRSVAEKHPISANRLQAILSSMYSHATEPDQGYTTNHPLKGMKKISEERQREPDYSNDDIRSLWEAFEEQAEPLQSLLKMLLLTGQRLGETRRMKWADIDPDRGIWIIPKEETKGGRTHTVPLSKTLIDLLENVHMLTGKSDYVFLSPMKENEPLAHFFGAVKRIRKYEGLEGFRIHDLRHIAITGMISLGIDMVHVGKTVAHKGLGKEYVITSRYAHYEYLDEKKIALNKWANHLQAVIAGEAETTKFFKIGGMGK